MTTPGNWAREFINGYEITPDAVRINYGHVYRTNNIMPQNVGVKQYAPADFRPTLALGGYQRHGPGSLTAWNRLAPHGVGNANDREFITTLALGNNATPTQGDICIVHDGTLTDLKGPMPYGGTLDWDGTFSPRGKRMPLSVLIDLQAAEKTTTNNSSAPYDDGAESTSTALGGVAVCQVFTPTGVAATGTIGLTAGGGGQPNDGDKFTLTIGGIAYVYTFKTALTPAAGEVLIGGTTAATMQNLFAAMTGGQTAGTSYATGTVPIPTIPTVDLETALVYVSLPSAGNLITLTAVNTGTAANAYTLVATTNVSTHLSVSGGTMTGGTAGDTYNVTMGSSASSGGAYTTFATFTGVGAVRQALRVEVAIGTAILEWIKTTYTLASGAGTSQTMGILTSFGRYFQS